MDYRINHWKRRLAIYAAIELNPPHLSRYQLTIEPNTLFGSRPPVLPDDDALWDIFEQGISY